MSGYQIFNSAGALVIDSNSFGNYYRDNRAYNSVSDAGAYNISTPIGATSDMGYVDNPYPADYNLQWFRPNNGSRFILCNGYNPLATANSGLMARTCYDVPIEGGYKEVYNGSGQLVWSAVSAAKIPRVIGFFDIPAGFDLDNSVYSQNIGAGTFILASSCPGNLSYGDGEGSENAYSGLYMSFSNGVLNAYWISRQQSTWANTMKPYGLRIPYAVISVLS